MTTLQVLDLIVNNPKYIWVFISFMSMIAVIVSLIRIHYSKSYEKFNLITLLFYNEDGKPSDSKMRINAAFIITSWAFIYLTVADKLTEWYVVVFLGAWVTDRISSRYSSINKQLDTPKD